MDIISLNKNLESYVNQCAELLYTEFKENWPKAWPTLESAKKEIFDCLGENKIFRVAVESNKLVGWVGGQPQYSGNVWEVHPIVVRNEFQKKGIGSLLLEDLEIQVKKNGVTLFLGSDDENGMTSVSEIDLYPDPLEKLMDIKNIPRGGQCRASPHNVDWIRNDERARYQME